MRITGFERFFVADVVQKMVNLALRSLAGRHSVAVEYVVDPKVGEEFRNCLSIATSAFLSRLLGKHSTKQNLEGLKPLVRGYFESPAVTREISKLLDPGFEVLDKEIVIRELEKRMGDSGEFAAMSRSQVYRAWEEFQKAFSFASRSAPHLREFLRASLEAGSFRVLANIGDVLERLGIEVSRFEDVERKMRESMSVYSDELLEYKTWSAEFARGLDA